MVRSWLFEYHERVYFLYSTMDLYKDMDDDGDVVFFLFSGTCYVARVGLPCQPYRRSRP